MTAKTKKGFHGGDRAHGADRGTKHEQLMKDHRRPGRAEGAMLHASGSPGEQMPITQPPPGPALPPGGASQVEPAGPPATMGGMDDESGDQT